jgi:hypothetical protein
MNIFEALRLSHETQRALFARLQQSEPGSVERGRIYLELHREMAVHAAAEERCFYLHLIQHDSTMAQARHGMAEHHEMDELVAALQGVDDKSAEWTERLGELRHKVLHHLDDEEHTIFQLAGKVLSDAQKEQLARAYEAEFATFRLEKTPLSSAED